MNNNKSYIIWIMALVWVMLLVPVSGAFGGDLWSMFELAKKKDPALQKAEAELQEALEDKNITRAQVLPSIDANAGSNQFWHNVTNSGSSDISGNFTGYNYSLMLRQPIINGPLWASLRSSDAGVMAARDRVIVVSQDLMVNVSEAYFDVLKARSDETIAAKETKLLNKILAQTRSFLKKGTGDIIAVYEAQARVDSSQAELIKAANNRLVAEQHLAIMTGLNSIQELAELSTLEPKGPNPPELEAWLEVASKSHPTIKQARKNLQMAEYNLIATKRQHWPTLDLSTGYTVNKGSAFLPEVATKQYLIGVNFSMPIFSGFGTQAKVRKARAVISKQEAVVNDSLEQVRFRTASLYLSVKNSVSFIQSLEQQKQSAEIQLKATRKGNTIGTRTIVDLLNAEQKYAAALRDLSNAGYGHLLFKLLLQAAAGVLVEDDLRLTNHQLSIKEQAE
ncbi:MAG: TolC family outer membrane protein [Desulforhopalus sp.]